MPDPPDPSALSARRDELRRQLAAIGDLRPGPLVQNYRRCGLPDCFCADKQHRSHGPYWLLTWSVTGKPRSRSVPAAQVAATQAQIAECQRLRRLVADLIAVSDDWCQARLKPSTSAAKKPASKSSPRRWKPKLPAS